jgi:hypothetical protein
VPVNAGAVAGVNVQRPQRVSARTNDVEARKARCPRVIRQVICDKSPPPDARRVCLGN